MRVRAAMHAQAALAPPAMAVQPAAVVVRTTAVTVAPAAVAETKKNAL